MRSRSNRGSTSSRNSPVNDAPVTVARSEPDPFTHTTSACRPRKSTSSVLAEVLPPPQLQIARSAPSLRERATSWASVVGIETYVIASNPLLVYFQRNLSHLSHLYHLYHLYQNGRCSWDVSSSRNDLLILRQAH